MAILFNFANPQTLTQPMLIGNNVQATGGSVDALPNPTLVNNVPISAIIELQSTNSGFVLPRMTTAQKNAIVTPVAGMQVFDSTASAISSYQAGAWGSGDLIAQGSLTNAQITGMFAAPVQIIPAPGAGLGILVNSIYLELVFVTANFGGGGVIILQYANTVHGGGTNTITNATAATFAATLFTANGVNQFGTLIGLNTATTASAAITNVGVFLSNQTGAFTVNGGASTVNYAVNYQIVPMV